MKSGRISRNEEEKRCVLRERNIVRQFYALASVFLDCRPFLDTIAAINAKMVFIQLSAGPQTFS